MSRFTLTISALLVFASVSIALAGARGGLGGRSSGLPGGYSGYGDRGWGSQTDLARDGPTRMPDEHRNGVAEWATNPAFKNDGFTFVRIRYSNGFNGRRG